MDPDPYTTLSKLGSVTIQRVSSPTVSTPENTHQHSPTPSRSNITEPVSKSETVHLPKLPSSINITVKTNDNAPSAHEFSADNASSDENILDNRNNDSVSSEHLEGQNSNELSDDITSTEYCPAEDSKLITNNANESLEDVEYENEPESNVEEMDVGEVNNDDEDDRIQQTSDAKFDDEKLPEIKQEFAEEVCANDLAEVPVSELIEGVLPDDVICKEETVADDVEETDDKEAEDDSDEDETDKDKENAKNRKKKRKTKSEGDENDSNEAKKQKTSGDKTDDKDKTEVKSSNLRKNIREVMDETKLDEATLSAQMQEKERLRRVQEQLRATRDAQRAARVLSLIEKGSASVVKKEEEETSHTDEQKQNTVVVKLSSGSGPSQIVNKKMLDLLKKQNSSSTSDEEDVPVDKIASLSKNLNKPQMMTASVSIAPVKQDQPKIEEGVPATDDKENENKDIVTISSSSEAEEQEEEEDDDCIVISEDEPSDEEEEDTGNSGMHTNDLYNVPDEQGRVLINVGHPENEKDVFLAPQIARVIKPHQIGGVRFLFDNIVESIDRYRTSEGFGCILAHSMGLGKTLQVVSFCDVFLRYTEGKTVLCVMPINTLQNWVAEFNMWLPVDGDNSPAKEHGEVLGRQFPLFVLNDNHKTLSARTKVIQNWHREGGVLLIGYELYRQLSLKKPTKSRTRSKKRLEAEEDLDDEKSKSLLEIVNTALVKPGPDLIICDEGHRIKNSHASISNALKQIRSKRRVVLTGYPLQNNLLEYWCMVDFVRPNYLGTKTEFSNMFERPIQNGQCIDSTPQDVKLMRYRAHVLHSLLEGFVQRRSHRVLQQTLPTKYEFVLLLRFTPFQRELYNTFMNEVVRTKAVPNPLKAFAVCCKIWNHPDILFNFLKKRAGEEDIDLDLEETVTSIGTPASGPSTPMTPSTSPYQVTNKRSRGRASKGSQNKDMKATRKNVRGDASQQPNKPLAVATVQPNTANERKSSPCEETATNTNNVSSIPSFDSSSFGNQYQNNYTGVLQPTDNENGVTKSTENGSSNLTSFGNQYSRPQQQQPQPQPQQQQLQRRQRQPDFGISQQQMNSVNQDFGNNVAVNYQQNSYNDPAYFQSEYNQNYWQGNGGGDNGSNFYNSSNSNSNTVVSNDEFFQSSTSVQNQNQQSFCANEYITASGQTDLIQSNFAGPNYNYDVGQQIFGSDSADIGGFDADNTANLMDPTNLLNEFGGNVFANDSPSLDYANQRNTQNSATFTQKKRLGRPPLQDDGKYKRNVVNQQQTTNSFANFKPGLLGGAPILKSGELSYQQSGGGGTNESDGVYAQSQLMDSIRNDGLWNSVVEAGNANSMFHSQNYPLYNETQQQGATFLGNEGTPSLLGGVRASRDMMNEIQSTDMFGSSTNSTNYVQSNADPNMFMDNFNYLNDLPLPSHTSFMGLLEGVDGLEANQNVAETSTRTVDSHQQTRQNNGRSISAATTVTSVETNQSSNQLPSMKTFGSNQNFTGGVCPTKTAQYSKSSPSAAATAAASSLSTQTNWDAFGNATRPTSMTNKRDIGSIAGQQSSFTNDTSKIVLANQKDSLDERQLKEDFVSRFATNRNVTLIATKNEDKTADAKQTIMRNVSQQVPMSAIQPSFVSRGTDNTHMLEPTQTANVEMTNFGCGLVGKPSINELDDGGDNKMAPPEMPVAKGGREESGIPYDWANDFFKEYDPGKIEASAKTMVFFCMLDQIIRLGDRLLLFSQSLFTLDLIEDYLHLYNIPNKEEKWARNKNYFRLDGSTNSLEREKLINEFNNNSNIHLFLVSTRAGSLGINLVGANRVVVFDASWNPCHDTQAVCRVYRYGQQKPCYVYRFVMDHCMEKKIYDRQINKQGMSDRIVDECNPDAYLTIKDVSNLCYDTEDENETRPDFSELKGKYDDAVVQKVVDELSWCLSKKPFQHESLLVDRTDKKLSSAEKRMAKRGYELEKQASLKPSYSFYNPPLGIQNRMGKPMASVRPMLADNTQQREQVRRWIPAEVWEKQGMIAQEMTLPLNVVIPTNTIEPTNATDSRPEIELKEGEKVMVLKSPKGIYMQLENGKIIAIKTALKPGGGTVIPSKSMIQNRQISPAPANVIRPNLAKRFVDPSLAALSNRRDVTVSPIRNRFPIPQSNMTRPVVPRLSNMIRPNHSVPRPYPMQQQRLLGRPPIPRPMLPRPPIMSQMPAVAGGKSMFGRSSAISISVPNKKRTEISGNMIGNEESASRLTEIRHDDYNPSNARVGIDETRKISASGYHEFSGVQNNGTNSRTQSFGQLPPSREAKNPLMQTRRPPTMPDALKNKKDVNLTSVARQSGLHNESEKIPSGYQLQQPYPLSSQQQPRTAQTLPNVGRRMQSSQMPKLSSKETAKPPIPVELPKNKSLSIFPVGKKPEEGAPQQQQQQSTASFQPEKNQQQQPQYQQQQQQRQSKSGGYYGNFSSGGGGGKQTQQPQQQYGNYSTETQQYSGQYDAYKQNYQPTNYPQSGNYSQTQQQSFSTNSQYQQPVSYPNNDFNQQSFQNQMFANSPSNASNAGYDQYGTYFNNGQQQSQSSSQPPLT